MQKHGAWKAMKKTTTKERRKTGWLAAINWHFCSGKHIYKMADSGGHRNDDQNKNRCTAETTNNRTYKGTYEECSLFPLTWSGVADVPATLPADVKGFHNLLLRFAIVLVCHRHPFWQRWAPAFVALLAVHGRVREGPTLNKELLYTRNLGGETKRSGVAGLCLHSNVLNIEVCSQTGDRRLHLRISKQLKRSSMSIGFLHGIKRVCLRCCISIMFVAERKVRHRSSPLGKHAEKLSYHDSIACSVKLAKQSGLGLVL